MGRINWVAEMVGINEIGEISGRNWISEMFEVMRLLR